MASLPPRGNTPYRLIASLAAPLAAFGATAGQVHPTGHTAWDVALVGLVATAAIWLASVAPWWAPALVGAAAGLVVGRHQEWILVGLAAAAVLLALATVKVANPILSVLSAGLSLSVLARMGRGPFFGASAALAIGLVGALTVVGLGHQSRRVRRRAMLGWGLLALFMVVSAGGFAFAAWQAKNALTAGNDNARAGITALKSGDFAAAAPLLRQAADEFGSAEHTLDRPWALLGRLVPVVAQNRTTAVRLVRSAHQVADRAQVAAKQIDPDALRVRNGGIDLAAVQALAQPVDGLHAALVDLQQTVDAPVSSWVPAVVREKLTGLRTDLHKYRTQIDNLQLAVQTAPALLGADAPRSYFVAFSTPAETRSIGGFVGNYAVLAVNKGAISMTGFGRSDDLRLAAPAGGMDITLPADFVTRYSAFDFRDPATGLVPPMAWKNIGITPDFPTMTSIVEQMYTATFHAKIDGVILMDPYPLAKLLDYTGPQKVAGYDTPIDSANAVDFILRKQYLAVGHDERTDLLDSLARQTITSLLAGALPSPIDLANDLGPYAHEHRLMMWTDQPAEQQMFDAVGLSGRFPPTAGQADVGITFNNAASNKVDAYLTHSVIVAERQDPDLGGPVVDVTLVLTNTVNPKGLPTYVTGNTSGLPVGTAYLYLSMYGPAEIINSVRDGAPLGVAAGQELGLTVGSAFVDIEPGQTARLTFTFKKSDTPHAGPWTVFVAPTAQRATSGSP